MAKRKSNNSNQGSSIWEFFKMGFGLGLGYIVVQIIMTIIALIFFISGFIMLRKEQAKVKKGEEANNTNKIIAYILMFIGGIFLTFLLFFVISDLGGEFGGDFMDF